MLGRGMLEGRVDCRLYVDASDDLLDNPPRYLSLDDRPRDVLRQRPGESAVDRASDLRRPEHLARSRPDLVEPTVTGLSALPGKAFPRAAEHGPDDRKSNGDAKRQEREPPGGRADVTTNDDNTEGDVARLDMPVPALTFAGQREDTRRPTP
jgi:hypothetical protein